jgi:aminoglycoside/choline kinase family phosphotransferase
MSQHTTQPPAESSFVTSMEAANAVLQLQLSVSPVGLAPCTPRQMREEMDLFTTWHLKQLRKVMPDEAQGKLIAAAFDCIAQTLVALPMVYVHSDARMGPVTSGIARLTRDPNQPWAEDFCLDITIRYWEKARKAGLPVGDDFGEFYRGVEWTGLQQHLTQAGQCAKQTVQTGEPHHVDATPQLISHIRHTCHRYRELRPFARLVETLEGIQVAQSYAFGRT